MKLLTTLILFISSFVFAKGNTVSYNDVRRTMDKMYAYHIDQKNLTPDILIRSLKIYCHQFDSDKLYFLQSEVDDYFFLSDRMKNEAMKGYFQDQYPVYIALSHTIDNSIARHRAIRDWVWMEILEGRFDDGKGIDWGHFATTDDDLARRMHAKASQAFLHYQKRSGEALTEQVKLRLIKRYERKMRRFEASYYHENERGDLLSEAALEQNVSVHILKSMAKSLDAHSAYYTPDEARELRTALKKQFEGIGVVLRETDEGVVVADMITGGPAERSGQIRIGDVLLRVDQKSIHEFSFEEVLDTLKCEHGKPKTLTIRNEKGFEKSISLKPEKIVLQEERVSYTTEKCRDGIIAKISLPGFYDNGDGVTLERDLKQAFKELKDQGHLYGVILDMRTNSGGFLTQAVKVASMFITKGIVVISKYSDGEMRYMRDVDGRLYFQGPMLVLTSKASASAAEILAQALQDYGIALVIGDERTYGKGSMQYQTVTLDNTDAFFKVTVGRYYTISGRSTQIEGVIADIVIPSVYSPYNIGERYLDNPLAPDHLDFSSAHSANQSDGIAPFFQRKEARWVAMLPELKSRSRARCETSPAYHNYIEQIRSRSVPHSQIEDYQMTESVNVLFDMINLSNPN